MKRKGAASVLSEIQALLGRHNFTVTRHRKHEIWTSPDGKVFTRSCTPSDHRAELNQLRDLRRVIGAVMPERGMPGERREKTHCQPNGPDKLSIHSAGVVNGALADQLSASGLVEDVLRAQIADLELRMARQLDTLRRAEESICKNKRAIRWLVSFHSGCWLCRFRLWWRARARARQQ